MACVELTRSYLVQVSEQRGTCLLIVACKGWSVSVTALDPIVHGVDGVPVKK